MLPTFSLAVLHVLLFISPLQAAKQCYHMDGVEADDTYMPCDADADASPCCATNKTRPDICLSSGLCYAQEPGHEGLIYSNGCTDQTGRHAKCVHFCPDPTNDWNGGPTVQAYNVLQCNSGNKFCCRSISDSTNCCGNSSAVTSINIGLISMTTVSVGTSATTSATATVSTAPGPSTCDMRSASNACPKDNTAVVGGAVGGALGAALLASLGFIAVLWMRKPKPQDTAMVSHTGSTDYSHKAAAGPPQELSASTPVQELPARGGYDDGYRGRL